MAPQRRQASGPALPAGLFTLYSLQMPELMRPQGYKEDSSKGPMLRFEESLPQLPVPTLEETAKRYLKVIWMNFLAI